MAEPYDGHIATTDGPLTSIVYVAFSISIIHFFWWAGIEAFTAFTVGKKTACVGSLQSLDFFANFLPNHWKAKQRCIDFVQIGLGV